jgi:hypothetical protein
MVLEFGLVLPVLGDFLIAHKPSLHPIPRLVKGEL